MPSLGGWEIVIILGVLVLLFGAKRLPDMARSIGQSARVFKGEMKGMKNDEPEPPAAESTTPPATPAAPGALPAANGSPPPAQPAPSPQSAAQNASGKPGSAAQ